MISSLSYYRGLTQTEINQLIDYGCRADDWTQVHVINRFSTKSCHNVYFTGEVYLGKYEKQVHLPGGIKRSSGIYNAHIHNCKIGNDVLISNIGGYIANYTIEDHVIIYNVSNIYIEGETSFGNGTLVEVINEGGGREVPIFDFLSTQLAYVIALYRHHTESVGLLTDIIMSYAKSIKSEEGLIGQGSKIVNSNSIVNTKIGPYTHIVGAQRLYNGSINSSIDAHVCIGEGVIMEHFIVASGASITDSTLVSKCFVGQGCELGKHYSAENSLFFANCQGFHGEACSIFAGPYTVTHHKSTLLIAGMFSFLNAGSGSNQSNHMYKLGPIHQGIVERGTKTTSDSYVLWPSHIGAFSLIMGRHYKHSDTSQFPFSYLIERNDESVLVPGMNLASIGTVRDSQKWPKRDKRTDKELLDHINFNLLSPYTVQKMLQGKKVLEQILENDPDSKNRYSYTTLQLDIRSVIRGIDIYTKAIWKYLGNVLMCKIHNKDIIDKPSFYKILQKSSNTGISNWIDVSGMFCPKEEMSDFISKLEYHQITNIEEVNIELRKIHEKYYEYEWNWVSHTLESLYNKELSRFTLDDFVACIEKWRSSVLDIDNMLYEDARKEFSLSKMTGFGIDGQDDAKESDFTEVRGVFDTNPTVSSILNHKNKKNSMADSALDIVHTILGSSEKGVQKENSNK